MHHTAFNRGRSGALAPAAALLLALCLLAVGAQAVTDPAATAALVVSGPGLYQLDHDLAPSDPIGVLINGSDVVFDGMGHRIAGTGANGSIGVLVTGRFTAAEGEMSTNVTVQNFTVSGWDDGIHLAETANSVVEGVVAEQNSVGLDISASSGTTDHHVVRDSVFRDNTGTVLQGKGILVMYPAQGITVERCSVTGNSGGIYADLVHSGSTPNLLADCDVSGNAGDGLSSHEGSFAIVRNCTVRDNGDDGLEFEHGGAEIVGNHVDNNGGSGINVGDRGGSDIHGNWIEGNAIGVSDGGDWPSHVRNNYLNNTDNGFFRSNGDAGTLNYTKAAGPNIIGGPYLGGNYWALTNGTGFSQTHPDTNGDGFCDEPYPVTEDAVDYLPLALQNGTPTPTPTPTLPFGGSPYRPLSVPGRIQAEDYNLGGEGVAYHDTTAGNSGGAYRSDGVDIEKVPGLATPNVGWIRNGEWLTYTVNVTTAGSYRVNARVASPNSGRAFTIAVDGGQPMTFTVPNTGSFDAYASAAPPRICPTLAPSQTPVWPPAGDSCQELWVTLAAGTHTLTLAFQGDGQNIDWFELTLMWAAPTPYTPLAIPGTIQAEDYDLGGEGVAYHDTTTGNSGGAYRQDGVDVVTIAGGHAVVGIEDGEWLVYSIGGITPTPMLPALVLYLGSDRDGGSVEIEVNGRAAGTVSVPNTGSPTTFTAVQTQVVAAAGTLRLRFHGSRMGMDRIESPAFVSTADAYATPNFTADRTNGTAPLTVHFTDTSSEWTYEWRWDFGDGATSTERNPVHTFQHSGVYSVSLTIKESDRWSGGSILHIWNDPSHTKVVQVTVEGTGTGHAIPGTIQAEDYNLGGEGVAYHDTTPGNSGGAYRHDDVDIETAGGITNVGWIRDGEWLAYTATIEPAETYALWIGLASPNAGRSVVFSVDGEFRQTIIVPQTGSFAKFSTAMVAVNLPAGTHTLRLTFQGDGQNVDWIRFTKGPVTTTPMTLVTTPVPSGAGFVAVPTAGPHGSAVKFTVTPAAGKSIGSAWWSFDAPAHLNTWNSRVVNPTFYYPQRGTFSPLVKLTYTDGSTETVQRTGYVRAT